jgi:hypothetical protein
MRESCVERRAALLAPTAITARHQQAAVGEIEKTFGFGARFEMPRDRTPGIAPHRRGTIVIAADAERHSFGNAAGELRVEQRVELSPVAGGERGIERTCEIGVFAVFHPFGPFWFQTAWPRALQITLEAEKGRCYY